MKHLLLLFNNSKALLFNNSKAGHDTAWAVGRAAETSSAYF